MVRPASCHHAMRVHASAICRLVSPEVQQNLSATGKIYPRTPRPRLRGKGQKIAGSSNYPAMPIRAYPLIAAQRNEMQPDLRHHYGDHENKQLTKPPATRIKTRAASLGCIHARCAKAVIGTHAPPSTPCFSTAVQRVSDRTSLSAPNPVLI